MPKENCEINSIDDVTKRSLKWMVDVGGCANYRYEIGYLQVHLTSDDNERCGNVSFLS